MQNQTNPREIDRLFKEVSELGNQESFKKLFSIFFARLNDFAKRIVKDKDISQDIVQDVFIKVWENREKYDSINIEAFLFKMVRNKCLDYIKHIRVINNNQEKLEVSAKLEELYRIDFVGDEPYLLIEEELRLEIEGIINLLPDRCKEVFILSRIKGLKNNEIASQLEISIKNVERHIGRALKEFRNKFNDDIPFAVIVLVIRSLMS